MCVRDVTAPSSLIEGAAIESHLVPGDTDAIQVTHCTGDTVGDESAPLLYRPTRQRVRLQ